MKPTVLFKRILSMLLICIMLFSLMPTGVFAAEADATLTASLNEAKTYTNAITINNSSNDPTTVVKTFKKHFTWDNEKRENSKSYLFDWSYYNGVVFEGIEYLYEVTGEEAYKDYVVEYMSSLINSNGTWATCTNSGYTSKQCAGYNATHGADCYKTASLLLDTYEMTGDSRYLTMAKTLYADLDTAANSYSLKNAGMNYRHTWASDPSPDLWLDGLYMILPFRAEYASYIGDTAELDLIVSRMQWVSDNMYNSSKKLFYHAADSATSNSGTYWLRSIGWYAAAIVDVMDHMEGDNLEAMKAQLVKLVDGMKACQNKSNGMWLNNMNASQSSTNPYETSGTALTCYAVIKAVNNGWLDKSYADMAILAFNGICNEKLSGTTLTDICFKGAPGSSNSTFYDNEGKGVGPFIMFYAEMLEYVNNLSCEHTYESVTVDATCVSDGITTYTCTLCGDSYSETIPATGEHDYKTVTVDATCSKDGSVTTTCTVCGDATVETLPATGEHDYESVITPPTYTEMGYTTHTCKVCGHEIVDSYVPVLEHKYTSVTVEPTCTEAGSITYTCSECGDSYAEEIPALGHDTETVTTEAGCLNNGLTVSTCKRCGEEKSEIIPATGHSFETKIVEPTCTASGSVSKICSSCGYAEHTSTASLGHNYESQVIVPTCSTSGCTLYTCVNCGDSYSEDVISAVGHDYVAEVTAPTCTEPGYSTLVCSVCGNSYVDYATAPLGHIYDVETVDGCLVYTCQGCGDTYTEDLPGGVVYEEVTAFQSNEYYVITVKSGSSYYALSHEDNELSAVKVSVSDGQITSEVTEDLLWNYSNKRLSYADENGTTRYLYLRSTTMTLNNRNASSVSISRNRLKIGAYYLRYSNGSLGVNKTGGTLALFQETEI